MYECCTSPADLRVEHIRSLSWQPNSESIPATFIFKRCCPQLNAEWDVQDHYKEYLITGSGGFNSFRIYQSKQGTGSGIKDHLMRVFSCESFLFHVSASSESRFGPQEAANGRLSPQVCHSQPAFSKKVHNSEVLLFPSKASLLLARTTLQWHQSGLLHVVRPSSDVRL